MFQKSKPQFLYANGYCKGIHAGAGNKIVNLIGIGIAALAYGNLNVVLNAFKAAELAFYHNAVVVRIFNHLAGERHVILVSMVAAVYHDGGEAAVYAAFAKLKAVAMVKMQAYGQAGFDYCGLNKLHKVSMVGVFARACGHLKYQRGVELLCAFGYALDYLHVIYVERAYGVAAFIGLFEHFGTGYKRHIFISFTCS